MGSSEASVTKRISVFSFEEKLTVVTSAVFLTVLKSFQGFHVQDYTGFVLFLGFTEILI